MPRDSVQSAPITLSDGTVRTETVMVPASLAVTGPWQLSVSAAQAISPQDPLTRQLDRLVSWRELPELKHYAGSATYTTDVDVPVSWIGDDRGLVLDLGEVFELARVRVNGREGGIVYAPPFRLAVTALVKPGRNRLEIEVPNQLKNHLEKGDTYRRPSGLLGPVLLVPDRRVTLVLPPEPTRLSSSGGDFTGEVIPR